MIDIKHLRPGRLQSVRRIFQEALLLPDQQFLDWFTTIWIKPLIVAFLFGCCVGMLLIVFSQPTS